MKSVSSKLTERKPRIAFLGAGVGLHGEEGEGNGIPVLIALLERLAVDFDVVIYSLIRVKEKSVPNGVRLRQITKRKIPGYAQYILLILAFTRDHFRRPFSIINAISAFPAGRMAIILGRIFGRPVIVHLIGSETVRMPEIGYGDLIVPRLEKITSWVCRKADVLIALTAYQKNMTEKNLQLNRDVTVLSPSVDIKKFPFRERSISYPIRFLHVASFHPVKDQETLFQAFAKIALQVDSALTLVGDGFNDPVVEQMLIHFGIENKVIRAGLVSHHEIWRHFDHAHILLHTSRYESQCGAVLEAMASGVPVCGTEVGILADLGQPFAVVVPPNNPDELAHQTLALIHDAGRYQLQQKLAREYLVSHDADWAAKKYKDLFVKWINQDHG